MNEKYKNQSLNAIIFVSGAAVMILELIGSRILAPYLGTSIFVWASLIGIILGSLSLGYYLGGQISEKNPQLSILAKILFFGGISILLITLIKQPVLNFAMAQGVKFGSISATLLLFALPSVILGMVSPYAIRLKIENIQGSGEVAGNLYALSTLGSIAGTFLAGFYLIPAFGSTQILFGLSLILILSSLLSGKFKLKIAALVFIGLVWLIFQTIPSPYIFETDSAYNHIRVADKFYGTDKIPIRILYLATETHSIIYKNSPNLFSKYEQFYLLDNLFQPQIKKALTLGGGAYVAPVNFLSRYPEAEMTVVEIDPKVTEVAKKYFQLADDPRLKIYHQDGRLFLNQNKTTYDIIYGDAFASYYSIPFQLTTEETVEKIYQSLSDNGILVLNLISSLSGEKSIFFQAEYLTLKQFFPQIYIFPAHYYDGTNTEKSQNIVIIASKNQSRLTKQELLDKSSDIQKELVSHLWTNEIKIDAGVKILTDEFAPVDYYISKLL
ncbi:MAG: fused MFS/spermidine synthase [Patescibacteria group bacterium]|jgi:spermidine synthase